MIPNRSKRMLFIAAVAGTLVILASAAFACTTYVGKLSVYGNNGGSTATSVGDGNNNCDVDCGFPDGSMHWCQSLTFNASATHDTTNTVTVTFGGATTLCSGATPSYSDYTPTGQVWDVNYISGRAMTTNDTAIVDAEDCTSWRLGSSVDDPTKIGTIDTTGGAATTTLALPRPTTTNNSGEYAGVCVSAGGSLHSQYGNQVPISIV